MRLSKELIRQIAETIASNIVSKEVATLGVPKHVLAQRIGEIITSNMQAEDRLNDEVRRLLGSHEDEIAKGGMDYRKVFELTKQKLAKERKMVL